MSSNPAVVIGITATDTARSVLQQVDQKIADTATKIDDAGQKVITRTQLMSTNVRKHFGDILQSAAGLGAGIVGFATSFSTLDRAQANSQAATLALARAQDTLQTSQTTAQAAQVAYAKALDAYQKKLDSGKASADELATAQDALAVKAQKLADANDKLKTNQQNLELATTKQKLAQDDASDAYTNFLANIPSQMIGFGVAAQGIWQMVGASQKVSSATTTASAVVYNGALASMNVANIETSTTTQLLGNTMRAVFLSNPITLPLIAISALIMAIAFNVGGLRDRINELGKAIGDAIPFLRPLLEAIGSLQNMFGGAGKKADDLAKASKDLASAQDLASTSADDLGTSTGAATDAIAGMQAKVMTLNDYLADTSSKLADTYHENLLYVESTGKVKDAQTLSNEAVNLSAEYLRKQASEAADAKQENFNLVASTQGLEKALGLTDTQLQKVAESIRLQKKASDDLKASTDATSDAYDKLKQKADTVKTALEALAEAQNRQVITQFGQQVGIGGTVSVADLNRVGLGGNADLVSSAASGRLGGVFVAGQGRVLDTGGQLYEDVIGIGKETGTPHLLHKNELVIPPSKISNAGSGGASRSQPAIIQFVIDSKVIAQATVDDITKLQGKRTRLQAKTYGQRFGVQK